MIKTLWSIEWAQNNWSVKVSCWGNCLHSCLHINWWNILTHAIIKDIFKFASCLKITIKYTLLFNPIVGIAFFCIATPTPPQLNYSRTLRSPHPWWHHLCTGSPWECFRYNQIKTRKYYRVSQKNAPKFLLNFSG